MEEPTYTCIDLANYKSLLEASDAEAYACLMSTGDWYPESQAGAVNFTTQDQQLLGALSMLLLHVPATHMQHSTHDQYARMLAEICGQKLPAIFHLNGEFYPMQHTVEVRVMDAANQLMIDGLPFAAMGKELRKIVIVRPQQDRPLQLIVCMANVKGALGPRMACMHMC